MYEGFVLPPLEAMSCGAPVIAGSASGIVEVTGGAARLVDPESTEEIARAILEVVENEEMRRQLAEAGRLRADEFSWSRTAQLTLEVYREDLRRKGEGRYTTGGEKDSCKNRGCRVMSVGPNRGRSCKK